MTQREIPGSGHNSDTKNKILDTATEFFALRGFDAVSMRDIARAVGIKMSSIYYYFDGKEALLEEVMSRFEKGYRHYFEWLTGMNAKAETLEEVMNNLFNKEFPEMLDPIGCFGMSLAIMEQHKNESVRKRVFELFYDYSIRLIQADFDRLIEKGTIPQCDTKTIATLFISFVLVGNDIRLHEYMGTEPPIDVREMYGNLKKFITLAITRDE